MKVRCLECLKVTASRGREIRFSCDTCIITLKGWFTVRDSYWTCVWLAEFVQSVCSFHLLTLKKRIILVLLVFSLIAFNDCYRGLLEIESEVFIWKNKIQMILWVGELICMMKISFYCVSLRDDMLSSLLQLWPKIPKTQLPGRRNELFWPVASELSACTSVDCGSVMRQGHHGAGST